MSRQKKITPRQHQRRHVINVIGSFVRFVYRSIKFVNRLNISSASLWMTVDVNDCDPSWTDSIWIASRRCHIKYQTKFVIKLRKNQFVINHVLFVDLFIWCRKNTSILYFICIWCCCLFQLTKNYAKRNKNRLN